MRRLPPEAVVPVVASKAAVAVVPEAIVPHVFPAHLALVHRQPRSVDLLAVVAAAVAVPHLGRSVAAVAATSVGGSQSAQSVKNLSSRMRRRLAA